MAPNLANYWMPFTANRRFKASPRLLKAASGMHYTSDDGRQILDGTAGLWCVAAGHGRRTIAEAVQKQLMEMDYAPPFQMGHPLAFEFAEKLSRFAPGVGMGAQLDRIFFTNSGSEAVDTALKIALAYHQAKGNTTRTRLIGRQRGYHGVGFGGISVGGLPNNKRGFLMLPGVDHIRDTHDLARNAFSEGLPKHGVEFADDLERVVQQHGADTIAAVIVEPVAGSAGVLLPPQGYLQRLRQICDKHGILLIFDEVITGFGRLGAPFGVEAFGVNPDMVTVAKALTNGAVPMGAVFISRAIHDAMMQAPENQIEFFHGYTYSGHPVACAAGMAMLDIFEQEQLLTRGANLEPLWQKAMHSLRGLPHVIDIRAMGLVAAIELAPRDGAPGERAFGIFTDCFAKGLLIRVTGDIIALSPPLIAESEHIETLVSMLGDAIKRAA
jgi:beta-alanine--pyruvate transaminase